MANYVSDWDYCDSGNTWLEWRGLRTKQYTYVNWLDDREELYNDQDDPYQQSDLAKGQQNLQTLYRIRARLKDLLSDAHDSFLSGTAYAEWYDEKRNLVKTGLGNI